MTSTPTTEDWNQHQNEITDLYEGIGLTVFQIRDLMRSCGFVASVDKYKKKFRAWGVRKNRKGVRKPRCKAASKIYKGKLEDRIVLKDMRRRARGKMRSSYFFQKKCMDEELTQYAEDFWCRLCNGDPSAFWQLRQLQSGTASISGVSYFTLEDERLKQGRESVDAVAHHKKAAGFSDIDLKDYEQMFEDCIRSDAYESKRPMLSRSEMAEVLFGIGAQHDRFPIMHSGTIPQYPKQIGVEAPRDLSLRTDQKPDCLTIREIFTPLFNIAHQDPALFAVSELSEHLDLDRIG